MLAMISHQNNFYFIDSQNLTPKLTKALVKRAQHLLQHLTEHLKDVAIV